MKYQILNGHSISNFRLISKENGKLAILVKRFLKKRKKCVVTHFQNANENFRVITFHSTLLFFFFFFVDFGFVMFWDFFYFFCFYFCFYFIFLSPPPSINGFYRPRSSKGFYFKYVSFDENFSSFFFLSFFFKFLSCLGFFCKCN